MEKLRLTLVIVGLFGSTGHRQRVRGTGMASSVASTDEAVIKLSGLRSGERAVITDVGGGDPSICHRMHLLGFTRGREVSLVRRAPFKGPMVFRICDVDMCLREAQALLVSVSRINVVGSLAA